MTQIPEALLRRVAGQADAIEAAGGLPAPLVNELREANYFSLLLPARDGGRQMDFPDYLRWVQAFGRADGSTGWCVNQASVLATLAFQMAPQAVREIWPAPSRSIANGPPGVCEAVADGENYRLSGQWRFSSGILQADYLAGVAPLAQAGKPREVRWFFFPRDAARIHDQWDVSGLKGTASQAFSVDKLLVPRHRALVLKLPREGPALYRIPLNLLFACGFAAVALGVSRGALDFAIGCCREKTKRFDRNTLSSNETVQTELGRAEAVWRSAETFLHTSVAGVWREIAGGGHLTDEHRITLRMAGTHVIRQSAEVTDIAYRLCSTDSIFKGNEIQRRFQDMHVITQHLQARTEVYGIVGRYLLGAEPGHYLM